MNCPKCGRPLDKQSGSCSACGLVFNRKPAPPSNTNGSGPIIWLALIGLILFIFSSSNGDLQKNEKSTQSSQRETSAAGGGKGGTGTETAGKIQNKSEEASMETAAPGGQNTAASTSTPPVKASRPVIYDFTANW